MDECEKFHDFHIRFSFVLAKKQAMTYNTCAKRQ